MKNKIVHMNSWTGADNPYLDTPYVDQCGHINIGRYGGNTSVGASKNEDGLLIWCDPHNLWEFIVLLDAHSSNESAELIINTLKNNQKTIIKILENSVEQLFQNIEFKILDIFQSEEFINACKVVKGESSCLICVRKENYLWWLSIGDCMIYLFHPDLQKLGQYGLNQRQFYEWIGQVNTFDLNVPSYSTGRRQLRNGNNYIVLITDGILDTDDGYYLDPKKLYESICTNESIEDSLRIILERINLGNARDSATIIAWEYENKEEGLKPSDQ